MRRLSSTDASRTDGSQVYRGAAVKQETAPGPRANSIPSEFGFECNLCVDAVCLKQTHQPVRYLACLVFCKAGYGEAV